MKTAALLSLILAVALGMPKPPASVEEPSGQKKENQRPLLGDWVPAQAGVVVEDPAPRPVLTSGDQQEKRSPAGVKQGQNMVEPEVEQQEKTQEDPQKEPEFKVESEVKVEVEPQAEVEPETEIQDEPEFKVESEFKEEPDSEEKFPVQVNHEREADQSLEMEETQDESLDLYKMFGQQDSERLTRKEVEEEEDEEEEEEEEEELMEQRSNVLYEHPNMELEPEMMEEPDALSEDEPELGDFFQQMSPSENDLPDEEDGMEMSPENHRESTLEMEGEEDGTELLRREESPAQLFEEEPVEDGGPQVEDGGPQVEDGGPQVEDGGPQVDVELEREQLALMREGPSTQGRRNCLGVIPDGKCYEFFRGPKTFEDAERFCRQRFPGGNLASITSRYIHEEVKKLVLKQTGTYTRAWIGGKRASGDRFTWLDGSPWDYAHWLFGEPNNTSGVEDCLEVVGVPYGTAEFNDFTCWTPQAFICSSPF